PIRDHADGKLEDQKTDPERDVDEGELEVGAQVPADPKGPEWDPYRERRRCLVRVEPTDLCDDLARQHAFAGSETRQNTRSYGRPPPRSVALWKRKGRRPEPGPPERFPRGARFAFGRRVEKLVIPVAPTGS